ncbi:MAG: Uma2 family endonuclease [Acidobacteria bacterium]|nr:Uma2 family endonuclease [Acidobacteriota bacterium]
MTDEEFLAFCNQHPDLSFETTAGGELLAMPQPYTLTGARNSEIVFQLQGWARRDRRGVVFDSSTGFVTPDGARKSPDAAWVLKTRIAGLDPSSYLKFWRLCPDFVIELKSESDRLTQLRKKMREWIANGAGLAWLIDPASRTVEVYRSGTAEPTILTNPPAVSGDGPLAGFVLDLAPVWDPVG